MKKTKRNNNLLFTLWCLSCIIVFVLFLIYWISVNKLIILILIAAALYQLIKRYSKKYLTLFYITAIAVNIFYALVKLL